MLLYLLAFMGGILTIVSPCILPVLPFVFARADQPFRRSGLPLLAGMAVTFAAVAGVATLAGRWIVRANQIGRDVAIAVFLVVGLSLLFPSVAEYLSRPFVRLGARVQGPAGGALGIGKSVILGVSTGLLWAPCAGPILGLILAGAAVQGASAHSALLLLAFAAGAASSLGVALLAGNRVFTLMKRSLGAEEWIRRGLGVAVLAGVAAIAFGWDQGILQRISLASTSGIEQSLVDRVRPAADASADSSDAPPASERSARSMTSAVGADGPSMKSMSGNAMSGAMPGKAKMAMKGMSGNGGTAISAEGTPARLGTEGTLPSLDGAVTWLNSPPLSREKLKGKVVVVDFWTYSCINCLRSIPYTEGWWEKYKNAGLVMIGVHTPEFAFEKDQTNVSKAVKDLKLTYPVAVDSNYAIWNAFHNQYWPAHYFIDRRGKIRYHHFGEGEYEKSEQVIRELLGEGDASLPSSGSVEVSGIGAEAAADFGDVQSPETYVGYARLANYTSPETIKRDSPSVYTTPGRLNVNNWGLEGRWKVGAESAVLASAPGKILFRFHARDLHLVLGPDADGKPIRFRVLLDGSAPMDDSGADVDGSGSGMVKEYRLYQLIREKGKVEDRTFQIEFLEPGVQAFAFTFG